MLQTLFHIPLGWLQILWAAGSLIWFGYVWRREGLVAAARATLATLAVIGLVLLLVLPAVCDRDGLPIRGYGVMLLLGLVSGVGLAMYRARRMGLNPDAIQALAFWLVMGGIIGARGFYVIEYWPEFQKGDLFETLKAIVDFTKGGLVVFGSALGAGLALVLFVRKYRLPGLALADLIAPSLMLGLAFGRVGCFLNGCCFGGVCHEPWAVRFPPGSPPHLEEAKKGDLSLFGLKMVNADPHAPAVIGEVEPGSPAYEAGLRKGQRVTRIRVNEYEFPGMAAPSSLSCSRQPQSIAKPPPATVEDALFALETARHAGDQVAVFTTNDIVPATWTIKQPPARTLPLHPAQLYAALDALLLCLLLLAFYPYRQRDGEVFALMITVHPISRFLQEIIRVDEAGQFGTGLSISQLVGIAMFAAAIGLWCYLARQPKGSVLPPRVAVS
ncbi:MAG TPA: prolipoprotein diacylglyceryl transferase family protein [Pirellulales bacterium]|nr:prolipoprotein diacylglyceryl transferase family protein [Pirellulales bacterium]